MFKPDKKSFLNSSAFLIFWGLMQVPYFLCHLSACVGNAVSRKINTALLENRQAAYSMCKDYD
jgi:hypothetical protein